MIGSETPGFDKKLVQETSSTLLGWQSKDEQFTKHGYQIIDGLSKQQSGPQETGPENRIVQKHDGQMISPDILDVHGQN